MPIDDDEGKPLINKVMLFVTGSCVVGTKDMLHIKFDDNNMQLLQADSCFNHVVLPITHESYDEFKKACVISISFVTLSQPLSPCLFGCALNQYCLTYLTVFVDFKTGIKINIHVSLEQVFSLRCSPIDATNSIYVL